MAEKEVDQTLITFREKRKWQIALRRYVLSKQLVTGYAPYFGLDISSFRKWIELQFEKELNWENFGKAWQFDHIVPVAYFDFNKEADLRLCWGFINIRVEKTNPDPLKGNRVDVLTAKAYFEDLFNATGLPLCGEMIKKITLIEQKRVSSNDKRKSFIKDKKQHLFSLEGFSSYEYEQLNSGIGMEDVQKEKEMLLKFGK